MMSIERVVAFVLGPIIAAGSAWAAGAVGKYGLKLPATEVDVLATTGAVAAGTFVLKWLHGRQNPEILKVEADAKAAFGKLPSGLRSELQAWIKGEITRGQQDIVHALTPKAAQAPEPPEPNSPAHATATATPSGGAS